MSSHRAVIDEFYRRMNAQDLSLTELCTPDVEWQWPPTTPGAATFRGRDEMLGGLATWTESWGELHFEISEITEVGDWVLAIVSYRLRGVGSGVALEHPVAHLHELTEGQIKRWWMFGDAEKARRRFLAGDRPA